MRFEDKVVWVTGASGGIGAALARVFSAEGAHVAISARRAERLDEVRRGCAGNAGRMLVVPLDLTDPDAIALAAARVAERLGPVDVLVNNAGVAQRALVADTDMAVYRRIMEVDYFGAVGLTKAVLPSMIARRSGQIVAVTSVAAKYSTPYRSGYNAAKAAMHGFFESLRAEVHRHGIAVTLIVPGSVRTDISVNALQGDGTPYGRMNRFLDRAVGPDRFAVRALDAIARRREEVTIAEWYALRYVLLKRFLPAIASRVVRLR